MVKGKTELRAAAQAQRAQQRQANPFEAQKTGQTGKNARTAVANPKHAQQAQQGSQKVGGKYGKIAESRARGGAAVIGSFAEKQQRQEEFRSQQSTQQQQQQQLQQGNLTQRRRREQIRADLAAADRGFGVARPKYNPATADAEPGTLFATGFAASRGSGGGGAATGPGFRDERIGQAAVARSEISAQEAAQQRAAVLREARIRRQVARVVGNSGGGGLGGKGGRKGKKRGFTLADSDSDGGSGSDGGESGFGPLTHRGVSITSLSVAQLRQHGQDLTAAQMSTSGFRGSADVYDDDAVDRDGFEALQFGGGGVGVGENGGGVGGGNRRETSRREQLRELVQRQRQRKRDTVRENEEQLDLLDELDSSFRDVRSALLQNFQRGEKRVEKDLDLVQMDQFERTVRELKFDSRANASERLKTNEELAQEQRAALETLEKERLKRASSGESDSKSLGNDVNLKAKHRTLETQEDLVRDESKPRQFGPILGDNGEMGKDDEDSVSDPSDSESESPSDPDSDSEGGDSGDDNSSLASVLSLGKFDDDDIADLPFSFQTCPGTVSELEAFLANRGPKHTSVLLHRLLICFNVNIDADHRVLLEKLLKAMLAFYEKFAKSGAPQLLRRLNALLKPLFDLTQLLPDITYRWSRRKIAEMSESATVQWPSTARLCTLALFRTLYPVTDFVHRVNTPVLLLCAQLLAEAPVVSSASGSSLLDVAKCVFLCNVVFSHVSQSGRYVPEAMSALSCLLVSPAMQLQGGKKGGKKATKQIARRVRTRREGNVSSKWFDRSLSASGSPPVAVFDELVTLGTSTGKSDDSGQKHSSDSGALQSALVHLVADLVVKFAVLYGDSGESASTQASLPEVVGDAAALLSAVADNSQAAATTTCALSDACAAFVRSSVEKLDELQGEFKRSSLVNATFARVVGLPQLNPRFLLTGNTEDDARQRRFTGNNFDLDPDADRRRANKLKKQVAREARAASRELRRDTEFVQREKARKRKLEDEYKLEQKGRVAAMMHADNAQFKASTRETKRHKGSEF
jgi:Nop14-like family